MTAFARASDSLFANTDIAEGIFLYLTGPGVRVVTRAVFQEPTQDVTLYGQTMRLASLAVYLPSSVVTPAKGDTVMRGPTTYVIAAAPELDSHATAWRCMLDPAGTPP